MDAMQIAIPVVGIIAVAAVTFYAVSFSELSQKSFRDLDEKTESENGGGGGYMPSSSSRERRARRQASKNTKS